MRAIVKAVAAQTPGLDPTNTKPGATEDGVNTQYSFSDGADVS